MFTFVSLALFGPVKSLDRLTLGKNDSLCGCTFNNYLFKQSEYLHVINQTNLKSSCLFALLIEPFHLLVGKFLLSPTILLLSSVVLSHRMAPYNKGSFPNTYRYLAMHHIHGLRDNTKHLSERGKHSIP